MRLGRFQLNHISDGSIRLDGGAVFGIVPRVLWERKLRPDDRNRVRLGLNCLLIRTPHEAILVDTGAGRKYSPKEQDIYGVGQEPDVVARLADLGMEPGDVDLVINTHLHFDHCGGNTRREREAVAPNFPNATYIVAREDYETATASNERTSVSYRGRELGAAPGGESTPARRRRAGDRPGRIAGPHPRPHSRTSLGPGPVRRRDRVLPGRPLRYHGPRAAPLDHGLRSLPLDHSENEKKDLRPGGGGEVAPALRP